MMRLLSGGRSAFLATTSWKNLKASSGFSTLVTTPLSCFWMGSYLTLKAATTVVAYSYWQVAK